MYEHYEMPDHLPDSLRLDRRVEESETMCSLYFVPEDGEPLLDYLPGQFLTLSIELPGESKPLIRNYTLSERPGDPSYYRLTVKREPPPPDQPDLPSGLVSGFLCDELAIGDTVGVKPPSGDFFLDMESDRPVVLLSGGVGLTPMISMLNAIVHSGSDRHVLFVHATQNSKAHAMRSHVTELAEKHSNVETYFAYEFPTEDDVQGLHYHLQGWINMDWLESIDKTEDADYFLCGRPGFMKLLYDGLRDRGVSPGRIHYEFFGPATVEIGEEDMAADYT